MSINFEGEMSNYSDFRSQLKKTGFSINNFYDVHFNLNTTTKLRNQLSKYRGVNFSESDRLMRLYTDEASLPGIQMSTGEYRLTNTPTLKYAYGAVFSEAQFSFIMDADAQIKSIFDLWSNWMYSYTVERESIADTPFITTRQDKFRSAYRDDYTVDILIVKYERSESSDKNKGKESFPLARIIPDSPSPGEPSGFFKAIPTYAVKLFKAFPSNIASIPMNSGTSELSKMSVGFEYETFSTTAIVDGKVSSMFDSVNGGSGEGILELLSSFI